MEEARFLVINEIGAQINVIAKNKIDAVDQYYNSMKSILGHQMKICGCFGLEKPLDRSKIWKPVRVIEVKNASRSR